MNWLKWLKDKTYMSVLGISLVAIVVSFILAYFIEWGWLPAMAVATLCGIWIRKIIIKRINKL
jgi:hypothetical protein